MTIFDVVMVLGCLALLMFGMKTMSEGLQKFAGNGLRKVLGAMTTNRFAGVVTGAGVTAAIQSSTATTLMTVSFVNAGLLTLAQAISVIMGANIGTTVTGWIIALSDSSIDLSKLSWIVCACTIPCLFSKKSSMKSFGEFLFGFAFMFLGIVTLRTHAASMDLAGNAAVVNFFQSTGNWGYLSVLLYVFIGGLLTLCVQSSAAIMAITMILCSAGVLPIYQGIALVMGENIGTTLTSNIAAMGANTQARRAALAHLFFNTFGVIWVLIFFRPFVNAICGTWSISPEADAASMTEADILFRRHQLNFVICTFHTAFNVINTGLLIGFIKPIETLVCKIIPNKKEEDEDFKLKFISSNAIMSTSELSLYEAQKETNHFAERAHRMFGLVKELMMLKDEEAFIKLFTRIEKYEGISDKMEIEIANYLSKVSEGRLSVDGKAELQCIMREASELESICDSCYNLARTIKRKNSQKEEFTKEQLEHILHMYDLVDADFTLMRNFMKTPTKDLDPSAIINQEHEINHYRTQLRDNNIRDINEHKYEYQIGVYYIDLIGDFEKIGDYIVNVCEARLRGQKFMTD